MDKKEVLDIFEKYLFSQATAEQINQLSSWIRTNKAISDWLEQQIANSSSSIDKDIQLRMFSAIKNQIKKEIPTKEIQNVRRFTLKGWMKVAAIFLLPLISGLFVYLAMNISNSSAKLVVSVDRGQKASVVLPDGSKAWINSLSELTYSNDFNRNDRILYLDGEAFFEVKPNPKKPFIVRTKHISVEALGTSFGVKAYHDDLYTSGILMTGKVKVSTPVGNAILHPNERITYDAINRTAIKSKVANATDFTGWIHNELRFENESLSSIAKTIQRIYNIDIVFSSERLKKLRYTGTVENNSLESMLNMIALTSPISFEINSDTIILYENKRLLKHYK